MTNFQIKNILRLSIFVVFSILLFSCTDAGVTTPRLVGDEKKLPDKLKGLEIYEVSIGGGEYVNVAVLNNEVNSLTYQEYKNTISTIIIKDEKNRLIAVKEILLENDSIIVCRK